MKIKIFVFENDDVQLNIRAENYQEAVDMVEETYKYAVGINITFIECLNTI